MEAQQRAKLGCGVGNQFYQREPTNERHSTAKSNWGGSKKLGGCRASRVSMATCGGMAPYLNYRSLHANDFVICIALVLVVFSVFNHTTTVNNPAIRPNCSTTFCS
ncbi:hypothetical protein ElyMa_005339000 [Elysia marginata]|uniref:Uncharacterized protein n=1 Tax=Elysia marginata TaxID=1093978 RepID=A0AAV4EAR4_9GAST|nr:hypothetical protein ElyMa_005339000 [Elysia marginata]